MPKELKSEVKTLVVVPAFNESGNVGRVVQELLSLPLRLTVLVIDDGSTDATAREAGEAGALVVMLPFNVGIGAAVQTGFKYAFEHNFDIAVQVDGDGQHDVVYLEKLIDPIRKGTADMVIGSRFMEPFTGYRSSFIRRVGIHFFAGLISFLTGCRVTDPTSGFRACHRALFTKFIEEYPHDFPEPEAIMAARHYGVRLMEVPVQMRKRVKGHSSIRYVRTLYYMVKVTFAILLSMLKPQGRLS